MRCEEIRFLLSKSADRRVRWRTFLRLTLHLRRCCSCMRYKQQMQDISSLLYFYRQRRDELGANRLSPEARGRIKQLLARHLASRDGNSFPELIDLNKSKVNGKSDAMKESCRIVFMSVGQQWED